jgi:hypothetical protein
MFVLKISCIIVTQIQHDQLLLPHCKISGSVIHLAFSTLYELFPMYSLIQLIGFAQDRRLVS